MRAAQYIGNRSLTVVDVAARTPQAHEVVVDVGFTGICGTDLHVLHGAMDQRVTLPAVLGHEMAGTIAAVGENVADWSIGDRVTVMPLRWCGECPACRAGHTHICHRLDFLGIDSPGSMQTQWLVPSDVLVSLPSSLTLAHAALTEPTAVAVHDVNRAGLNGGERVVIVGGGPIGLLVACVARSRGAEVMLLEVSEQRLGLARELGLQALDGSREDLEAVVADWTRGREPTWRSRCRGPSPVCRPPRRTGHARPARRRRHSHRGTGGGSLPPLLARAHDHRRPRLRAPGLRAGRASPRFR